MKTEETTIVALLHDVVEDTEYTIDDLIRMGFDKAVTDAIALMTHAEGVDYMDYVRQIQKNPVAKAVKLADLRHNSDLSRLDFVDEKALLSLALLLTRPVCAWLAACVTASCSRTSVCCSASSLSSSSL